MRLAVEHAQVEGEQRVRIPGMRRVEDRAPEQALGRPTFRSDVFAVGLIVLWAAVRDVSLTPLAWASRVVPMLLLGTLLGYAAEDPSWLAPLAPDLPALRGEVRLAVSAPLELPDGRARSTRCFGRAFHRAIRPARRWRWRSQPLRFATLR